MELYTELLLPTSFLTESQGKKKVLEYYCFISEKILKPITLSNHSYSAITENGWAWGSLLKVLFPWV